MQCHSSGWKQFLLCNQVGCGTAELVAAEVDEESYEERSRSRSSSEDSLATVHTEGSEAEERQVAASPVRVVLELVGDGAQLWPPLRPEEQEQAGELAFALFQSATAGATTEAKPQSKGGHVAAHTEVLEGIWLGGKQGDIMDHIEEIAFVEVDCRNFSSGHFYDRQAQSSLAFARNVRALRELSGDIHRARADGQAVYVHCAAGRNRGPAAVVAYLLLYAPTVGSLEEAFSMVRALRRQANTNSNTFYQELLHICRSQGKTIRSCTRRKKAPQATSCFSL